MLYGNSKHKMHTGSGMHFTIGKLRCLHNNHVRRTLLAHSVAADNDHGLLHLVFLDGDELYDVGTDVLDRLARHECQSVDAAHGCQLVDGLAVRGKGINRLVAAELGNFASGSARFGQCHDAVGVQVVGQHLGMFRDRVRDGELRVVCDRDVRLEDSFDAGSNIRHCLDRLDRVFAERRFFRSHDRVRSVEDRVGDVGHLRTGRIALVDHRFHHLGGDDAELAFGDAFRDDVLLLDRNVFAWRLHGKVTSGDHRAVNQVEDLVQMIKCLLRLDLGNDARIPIQLFEDLLKVGNVRRRSHE